MQMKKWKETYKLIVNQKEKNPKQIIYQGFLHLHVWKLGQ